MKYMCVYIYIYIICKHYQYYIYIMCICVYVCVCVCVCVYLYMYIYMYYINMIYRSICILFIGIMISVRQWPGIPRFNPRLGHTKDSKKWYLIPLCVTLSIIRVSGAIQGKKPHPPSTSSVYNIGSKKSG